MNELLVSLMKQREELRASMTALTTVLVTENRSEFDETEEANFNDMEQRLSKLETRIEQLQKIEMRSAAISAEGAKIEQQWAANGSEANGNGTVHVRSDAAIYTPESEYDFATDLIRASFANDFAAQERLSRHQAHAETEMRAGTGVIADLAGLAPPAYLLDMYAPILHENQPFVDAIKGKHALNGKALNVIPYQTEDLDADVQEDEFDPVDDNNVEMDDLEVRTRTIAGRTDASRQSLELSTINPSFLYEDLFRKVARRKDIQVLHGAGGKYIQGVFNTPGVPTIPVEAPVEGGIGDVDGFRALWAGANSAKARIRRTFTGKADIIVMDTERWAWISSILDSEGRPLLAWAGSAPTNVGGTHTSIEDGIFCGLTVVVDDNIGASQSVDGPNVALVCNSRELHIWQDNGGQPRTITAEQVRAHELGVRLVGYTYVGFTAERYPEAKVILDLNPGS